MKIARGVWQRHILDSLLSDEGITSPYNRLKGKAKKFQNRYRISFENLLERMDKAGYKTKRTPGKRGGEPTAIYKSKYMKGEI